jgi:16S rRNA C1402 (ribose-2'-O) methylase RsmI
MGHSFCEPRDLASERLAKENQFFILFEDPYRLTLLLKS